MSNLLLPSNVPFVWNPRMPGGMRDGLVWYVSGESSAYSHVHDGSGHERHGTVSQGSPYWTEIDGRPCIWLKDNGSGKSNDAVDMPTTVPVPEGGESTFLYRVSSLRIATDRRFAWRWPYTQRTCRFEDATGEVQFFWRDDSSHGFTDNFAGIYTAGDLRFFGVVSDWDANAAWWVIDGGLSAATMSGSGFRSGFWPAATLQFGMGSHTNYYGLNGVVCEPMLWHRKLTAPEIEWLANPANHLRVPWRRKSWLVGATVPAAAPAGAGTLTLAIGATGGGARDSAGAGSAGLAIGATGDGARDSAGAGSAGLAIGATGDGSRDSFGAGIARLVVAAAGVGARDSAGAGTAGLKLGAHGAGSRDSAGGGAAVLRIDATGDGSRESEGAGTVSLAIGATGDGSRDSFGAGIARLVLAAAGVGRRDSAGAGSVGLATGATGTGSRESAGAGTVALVLGATGAGMAPIFVPPASGAGTVALALGARGDGYRNSEGSGSATLVLGAIGAAKTTHYVSGPYRVLAAKIHAAGAAEGAVFCGGARTGKIHTAGATAGKIA